MTDHDLIQEARRIAITCDAPSDGDLLNGLADALEAAAARADQLEKALRDFEKHGLRCDLNPTMHLADVSTLYSDFVRYLARVDEGVRSRAAAALAGVPAAPATEEQSAVECDGGPYCAASPHRHGCFADRGDCDKPGEHAAPSVSAGTKFRCERCGAVLAAVSAEAGQSSPPQAEYEQLRKALARAAYVSEHLFGMIDRETWRSTGGDDGQGHYEGDYRAEKTLDEIREWAALAGVPAEPATEECKHPNVSEWGYCQDCTRAVDKSAASVSAEPATEEKQTCPECGRDLHGYRGPLCRYCDGTAE